MKRVILHIGTEKTATTSLQRFCAMNSAALSAAGVWYPCGEDRDYVSRHAHFPLPASLFDVCPDFVRRSKHFRPDALFRQLTDDINAREEPVALLSAEHFSSRCSVPERLQQIRKHLSCFEIHVIVYIRPQSEFLISAYSEHLKNGGVLSLDEIGSGRWVARSNLYLNYLGMLQPWMDAFGRDHIRLRIFQSARLRNGDIFADFLWSALGIEGCDGFERPAHALNTLISLEAAHFLYFANQKFSTAEQNREDWEAGQAFRGDVMPRFPQGQSLRRLLNARMRAEIERTFAEDNRRLAESMRPDLDGVLFLPDAGNEGEVAGDPAYCFNESLVAWIVDTWKMARQSG